MGTAPEFSGRIKSKAGGSGKGKAFMAFSVGEMVGPYRIIEQLGQGGMATVYKAYHAALDRYVAIKVLHPALLADASLLARFQREARLVAKLDHPNIVPIHDYAEQEGHPYLVMKFIEGETLKARLARGPVGPDEIAHIAGAIGAALAYAHKNGILHRDIKPSNVLLAADGQIYLADFGLARIAQSGDSTLTSDMILGTPQYISPEQALGKKDLEEGTDIYSLGVMLYEMIVGKVPFSADTPFSVIHDHIYTALPLPRTVNPCVSEAVERVLLKALAKERIDRYKDVDGMVKAFQEAWKEGCQEEEITLQAVKAELMPAPESSPSADTMIPTALSDPIPPVEPVVTAARSEAAEDHPVLQAEEPGRVSTDKKKSLGWMWLTVSIILILICMVSFFAFLPIRQQVIEAVQSIIRGIGIHIPLRRSGFVPGLFPTILGI
jgi:serine/threonine protein kinase